MFDKQKIIRITAELENFIRALPNVYVLPESSVSPNILSLLKRLNANVKAIISNAPNLQQKMIRMPSGEYLIKDFLTAVSNADKQTCLVVSAAKPVENSIFPASFNIGSIKISIPAFSLTDEEAQAIYDRITMFRILKQYQDDGVPGNGLKDISTKFARGMSTFIDSRFQDVKVQVWDRREFEMPVYEIDDTAIVIQGPIQYMDNYTITTARLYREWYPNAPIVISTWKNEATDIFRDECRKINVVLLENDLPAEPGYGHINYQLESSLKGVEYVKNHTSAKFVLKCRTDQRLNRTDFLIYFKNLLKAFPPNGDKINERIIVLFGTKWTPFHSSDFLYFGEMNDMNKLFNIPKQSYEESRYFKRKSALFYSIRKKISRYRFLQKLKIGNAKKLCNYNIMENKFYPPEIYILKVFYQIYIEEISPSKLLQIYWKFLRDYLIVAERCSLLFDWQKYANQQGSITSYYDIGMDFARWLDIYLNYKE